MNDFMFHSVLQNNIKALNGLLCALLHLPKDSITDIQIMNPIEFGKDIMSKICVLDFSLDGLTPKLYSEFKMVDTKTSEIYSDKLSLYVLNLQQTDNTDYEQEDPELYYWAKLFKATEWEEFKMLAEKNEYIKEVVFTLHEMSEEEKIREECEARERYYCEQKAAERIGRTEGRLEGRLEGQQVINDLNQKLITLNRLDDLKRATTDPEYQSKLIDELL